MTAAGAPCGIWLKDLREGREHMVVTMECHGPSMRVPGLIGWRRQQEQVASVWHWLGMDG